MMLFFVPRPHDITRGFSEAGITVRATDGGYLVDLEDGTTCLAVPDRQVKRRGLPTVWTFEFSPEGALCGPDGTANNTAVAPR